MCIENLCKYVPQSSIETHAHIYIYVNTCIQSVLESAKEEVESVRDEVQRLGNALTSPSLQDLCQSFHSISVVNQVR